MHDPLEVLYASARAWVVSFDTTNPAATLSVSGAGCQVVESGTGKEVVLTLPFIRHSLVRAESTKATILGGPAVFPVYCRVRDSVVSLSNVACALLQQGEEVAIRTFVLAQQLQGANYPIDNLFADIQLLEASAAYAAERGGLRYLSTVLRPVDRATPEDALGILYASFDAVFSRGQPAPVLLSGGYDSRFNLAIALRLSKRHGNALSLWHEFKEPLEHDIAQAVARKVDIPLHVENRTSAPDVSAASVFNSDYIRFQSGTYRDNLPRWHAYLRLILSRVPGGTLIGFGAEAHKGKFYDIVNRMDQAKKVLGTDPARISLVAKQLGIGKFDRDVQDRFFEELHGHAAVFPDNASKIDFIHYHTYISNGYGRRCHDLLQFFGIPFPFLNESFLSCVFSLPPEKKKGFKIVRDGIAQLAPQLLDIPFISGNIKSLKKPTTRSKMRELFYTESLRKLRLSLLPVRRKGRSSPSDAERARILAENPQSAITRTLQRAIADELRSVALVRLEYVIQAFLYFKLLEREKGVSIRCV